MWFSSNPARIGITLAVALGTVAFNGSATAALRPAVVDLGTLPGHVISETIAINDYGWVAGNSYMQHFVTARAVRWDAAHRITELDLLPGATSSMATAINNRGTVVGASGSHAVRWDRAGRITELGLPGGDRNSLVTSINNKGVAVGATYFALGRSTPVRWERDGGVTILERLSVDSDGYVSVINDRGVSAGNIHFNDVDQGPHALRWDRHGRVTDLGTLPGAVYSQVFGVTDAGTAAGTAQFADSRTSGVRWTAAGHDHVVRWERNGRIVDLGTLPGTDLASWAVGINAAGTVIGNSFTAAGGWHAVLWSASAVAR